MNTKLNKQLIERIVDNISKGISIQNVCAMSGISKDSYYRWLKRGREDWNSDKDTIFAEFTQAVGIAKAKLEEKLLSQVMTGDPMSARWLLSRMFREDFGDKQTIEHDGDMNVEIRWPPEGDK